MIGWSYYLEAADAGEDGTILMNFLVMSVWPFHLVRPHVL